MVRRTAGADHGSRVPRRGLHSSRHDHAAAACLRRRRAAPRQRQSRRRMRTFWAFGVFCGLCGLVILGGSSTAAAQSAPTGYVSVFADHLPNRDATELRGRMFAEKAVDAGSRLRLIASGFVEGLVADRNGRVRDAVGEAHELTATLRTKDRKST